MKNFSPISNLTLSKIIERVVASRLSTHRNENNLAEPMQSAYWPGHSTETALLHVYNNILRAVDEQKAVAFDTVDHNIMLSRLSKRLGAGGVALRWFESSPVDVLYGASQGSILGPKLFTIYTLPIADIARKYNLEIHLYADDTQIYITFRTSDNISEEIAICGILQIYCIYILHHGYCDRHPRPYCLTVVRPRLESYGSRVFSVAATLLWNEQPYYITGEQTLTSFKTKLKTHLFSEAYPQTQ